MSQKSGCEVTPGLSVCPGLLVSESYKCAVIPGSRHRDRFDDGIVTTPATSCIDTVQCRYLPPAKGIPGTWFSRITPGYVMYASSQCSQCSQCQASSGKSQVLNKALFFPPSSLYVTQERSADGTCQQAVEAEMLQNQCSKSYSYVENRIAGSCAETPIQQQYVRFTWSTAEFMRNAAGYVRQGFEFVKCAARTSRWAYDVWYELQYKVKVGCAFGCNYNAICHCTSKQ